MTQKLTEEQQRAAHKIIVANRGDCAKSDNYLDCADCPWFCNECSGDISDYLPLEKFHAENLRRSQAWLDAHQATPQEPPKRRPTPEEMVIGAPVRVRLWDELVRDGKLDGDGNLCFENSNEVCFHQEMKKYCGNTYKVIKGFIYGSQFRVELENCLNPHNNHWNFTADMLDYVEPEKVVEPKATEPVNFFDWCGKKVVFKDGRNNGASYTVCSVTRDLALEGLFPFESTFIFKLLELEGLSYSARLFNLCETQDNGLRIVDLENQVKDLTKKLTASERKCDRLARRLRAKWQAARDGEMATWVEIEKWIDAGKGSARRNGNELIICPNSNATWIPATRGNLKL